MIFSKFFTVTKVLTLSQSHCHLDVTIVCSNGTIQSNNLHITSKSLGTKLLETKLLKTVCLWNFLNLDRKVGNNPVPKSVEAIAGAVYGQQF